MTLKQHIQDWLSLELSRRVSAKELLLFYTQMTILIESGTSVPLGLEALEKQTAEGYMKQIIGDLKRMVHEGQMLSQAMANYPKLFSPIYAGMMRAGESGGFLPKIFQRIVMLQEREYELRGIIHSAFAYPCLLLVAAVGVVSFMVTVILPRFITIYKSSGVVLPLITRVLLVVHTAISAYWFLCLPLLGGLVWAVTWYLRSTPGKSLMDSLKIDLPLIGSLFRQVYLERLLRTLGILLDSKVPIHETIHLTRDTIGHKRYEQLMTTVLDNVNQGQRLAMSFSQSDLIPPTVSQMVQTGEDAGTTGAVMNRMADFYQERIRGQIRVLTRLLEPAMTLVMGGVIGFVALALILPILQLSRTLNPS